MRLFWSGFLLSLSLCLDLGLVNVAAMRAGVSAGGIASFALGLGSCFGDLLYAAVAVAGVAVVLGMPAVRWIVWIAGTVILAYLSIRALRDAWGAHSASALDASTPSSRRTAAYFVEGFGLALASPSAILWFATVGGAVMAETVGHATTGIWTFFAGFFTSGVVWSAFVAIVSAQGRRFGARFTRVFGVASALVFAWLAVSVFINGYRAFASR